MSSALYPSLVRIDEDLFGTARPGREGREDREDLATGEQDPSFTAPVSPAMPARLRELILRRAASEAAYPPAPLAVGQIRRLNAVPAASGQGRPLGRPCGILLSACLGGKRWSGWIVAQESDYACDRDLVLQQEDGPLAPEAAMVQTWNPVEVILHGDEPVLGKLSAESLGAAMRLAGPRADTEEFVAPRPGRIGAWDLDGETTVVTGTPLGEESDPRHAYQRLYRQLAGEIRAAAASVPQPSRPRENTVPAWLRRTFVTPAWTFAALLIAVFQGIWLFGASDLMDHEAPIYRGVGQARTGDPCATLIRLTFKPDVSYTDVIVALRRMDVSLVDGPSETGEVWVSVSRDRDVREVASMFAQSHLVENADVIEPDPRHCGK